MGERLHQPPAWLMGCTPSVSMSCNGKAKNCTNSCRETDAQGRESSQELNPALVIGLTHRDCSCKQVEP